MSTSTSVLHRKDRRTPISLATAKFTQRLIYRKECIPSSIGMNYRLKKVHPSRLKVSLVSDICADQYSTQNCPQMLFWLASLRPSYV